jgi:MoxR-like ATPase
VLPQDVLDVTADVLRHRLVLSYDALADGVPADHVVKRILQTVPLPQVTPRQRAGGFGPAAPGGPQVPPPGAPQYGPPQGAPAFGPPAFPAGPMQGGPLQGGPLQGGPVQNGQRGAGAPGGNGHVPGPSQA